MTSCCRCGRWYDPTAETPHYCGPPLTHTLGPDLQAAARRVRAVNAGHTIWSTYARDALPYYLEEDSSRPLGDYADDLFRDDLARLADAFLELHPEAGK